MLCQWVYATNPPAPRMSATTELNLPGYIPFHRHHAIIISEFYFNAIIIVAAAVNPTYFSTVTVQQSAAQYPVSSALYVQHKMQSGLEKRKSHN